MVDNAYEEEWDVQLTAYRHWQPVRGFSFPASEPPAIDGRAKASQKDLAFLQHPPTPR